MNKTNFDAFEYPSANETGAGSEQFFVVQDNETFLISAQNINNTQAFTVYDVAPQQFLVDVENASELISADQYVNEAQSNLFSNSYLVQPETAIESEPMEQNAENLDEVSDVDKQSGACTEITLSDDQYQMLEQKGWLLLKIGDKIYVLNTLGLHDITTNNKLIEKLKNESLTNASQDLNIGTRHLESYAGIMFGTDLKDFPQSLSEQTEESVKIVTKNNISMDSNSIDDSILPDKENVIGEPILFTDSLVNQDSSEIVQNSEQEQENETSTRVLVIENENIRREGNTLKVKTKLSLKGFPDKILLGNTLKGKRLVAKVIKKNTDTSVKTLGSGKDKPEEKSMFISMSTAGAETNTSDSNEDKPMCISLSEPHNNTGNNSVETEFYKLLQHLFRNNANKMECTADDIVTADSVVTQLLQIPAFKQSVLDNDLIITKVFHKIDANVSNKVLSAVVTGKVSEISEQWRFIHLPHMLQKMINDTEELMSNHKKNGTTYSGADDFNVLHIQITEVKDMLKSIVRMLVTVNKRTIPIQLIANRHQPIKNKMYGCSACGEVYATQLELSDHQADHCLEGEDKLTIDIVDHPHNSTPIGIVENEKGKSYSCMQCNATFNRLTTCKNHLKTHCNSTSQENVDSTQDENNSKAIYKCTMCTCTYFHPSTLSKHILARHINKVALLSDNSLH